MPKNLDTDEKIAALVDDMATWGEDDVLSWAQDARVKMLRDGSPEDVDLEYAQLDPDGGPETGLEDDTALDRIADILDGREWNSDALDEVARLVRATGREIKDNGQGPEGEE